MNSNKVKNKRYTLLEAEVIDTAQVELTDLLSASSKAEKAILDLCDKCLAFNNTPIKNMSLQLKSRAAALTQAISNLEITGDVTDVGGDQLKQQEVPNDADGVPNNNLNDTGGMDQNTSKRDLEMPEAAHMIESAKVKYLKRKKLKESDLEIEAAEPGGEDAMPNEEKVMGDEKSSTHVPPPSEGGSSSVGLQDSGKVIVDLSEPFEQVIKGLDDMEFQSFKSNVIAHLENAIDPIESKKGGQVADQFTKSIEALNASQSVDDFDLGMDQIYDFADENDILVETVIKKK